MNSAHEDLEIVTQYLEKHLGTALTSSVARQLSRQVQIKRYSDQPFEGADTLASAGFSGKVFIQEDGSSARYELLFCTYSPLLHDSVYQHLFTLIEYLMQRAEGISLGELIELESPLLQGSVLNHLFLYSPVYFGEALYQCTDTIPPTLFAWCIPVSEAEASFITEHGEDAFNDLLEQEDPDLCNLLRESLL